MIGGVVRGFGYGRKVSVLGSLACHKLGYEVHSPPGWKCCGLGRFESL